MKQEWINALEKLRFDIVRREPLQGHKEYAAHSVVEVFVDDRGQIRLALTRLLNSPKGEMKKSRTGREYQVFREQTHVTIVNYELRAGEELGMIVNEMEKEIAG